MEGGDHFFGEPLPSLSALEEVKKLALEENAAEEALKELLQGFTCGEMEAAWSAPDGMCSGLWCSFWELDENTFLAVYYDPDGYPSEVFIREKEEQ